MATTRKRIPRRWNFSGAYAVELDGIITRLNAIEEKYNPGGRELAAKTDALYEKYEAMLS